MFALANITITLEFGLGIFSNREDNTAFDIDEFIKQRILTPKVFLGPVENEQYIRVYGQPKYAVVRSELVRTAMQAGDPFWQGKVFVESGTSDEGEVPVKALYRVVFQGRVIGELSEFDRRAADVLDFENPNRYVARAVIQDDLIGCLVQLFVDPENKL
jgi:hypothetical protein